MRWVYCRLPQFINRSSIHYLCSIGLHANERAIHSLADNAETERPSEYICGSGRIGLAQTTLGGGA